MLKPFTRNIAKNAQSSQCASVGRLHQGGVLLLLGIMLCTQGCRNTKITHMDQVLWKQINTTGKVAAGRISYDHDGNVGLQSIGGGAIGGAIGYAVFAALDSTNKEELAYVEGLNEQVRQNIYAVLKSNTLFHFDDSVSVQTVKEFPEKLKREAINQAITDKHLASLLEINVYYTHKDDISNRLAMLVQWTFHSKDAKQKIKIDTWAIGEEKTALLPNTRNPKYEKQYAALATQNAQELIRILTESMQQPVAAK